MNMTPSWTEGSATGDGTTVVQVSRLELRREGEVVVQQSEGLVYVLYINLVAMAGTAFAGFANYLIPVVGVFLGVVFLHDHLSSNAYASLAILALAIVISEWKPHRTPDARN